MWLSKRTQIILTYLEAVFTLPISGVSIIISYILCININVKFGLPKREYKLAKYSVRSSFLSVMYLSKNDVWFWNYFVLYY
jgi:hypothetical protein